MNNYKKTITAISFLFVIVSLFSEDKTRNIRDETGYFWDKTQLTRLMDHLKENESKKNPEVKFFAGISPHDDYLYAAKVYYKLFSKISPKEVVIFGVTHNSPRKAINHRDGFLIFDSFKYWKGVLKRVVVSSLREEIIKKLPEDNYIINNNAHELEHSIEAMIPFLQYYNKNIKITPIMVTGMDFNRMRNVSATLAGIISNYIKRRSLTLGKDIFFLISSDANHYGKDFNNTIFGTGKEAHKQATEFDKKISERYLTGTISKSNILKLTGQIWGKDYKVPGKTLWCGRYSIPFGMLTVLNIINKLHHDRNIRGSLLSYSDSYSEGVIPLKKTGYGITAPFSLEHWVGYFSAGFYF